MRIYLVPEQAKELKAYYECECELQLRRLERNTGTDQGEYVNLASSMTRRRVGPVAWCRRVWNGAAKQEDCRRTPSLTSTAAHFSNQS